jgi:hypothetical protein
MAAFAAEHDLAMFNLANDSKLRGCDLVRLRLDDVFAGGRVRDRAAIMTNPRTIATSNNAWATAQVQFNREGRSNDHFRRRVGGSVLGFLGLAFALGR